MKYEKLQQLVDRHLQLPFPGHPDSDELAEWIIDLSELDGYYLGIANSVLNQKKSNLLDFSHFSKMKNRLDSIVVNSVNDKKVFDSCISYMNSVRNIIKELNDWLVEEKVSVMEAFNAMRSFLEEFYNRTKSDDVGSLLGDLQFSSDDRTMDPAAWEDWLECVKKTKSSGDDDIKELNSHAKKTLSINKRFLVELCSDLDYKEMVVDISLDHNAIAVLNKDKGVNEMEIEFLALPDNLMKLKVPLHDFVEVLAFAEKCLKKD